MANRDDLQDWVLSALEKLGGSGSITAVAEAIWHDHERDLRNSGNLFFTWQYDMRWACTKLRDKGCLRAAEECPRGVWRLTGA